MRKCSFFYTAIGDSLTTGFGSLLAPGFVEQYARISQTALNCRIIYKIIGKNGASTHDVLRIMQNPRVQYYINNANIITITAGGNDIIDAAELYFKTENSRILEASFQYAISNIYRIISFINLIKKDYRYPYIIRIINLYNPYPKLVEIDNWINNYNEFLNNFQNPILRVANIYNVFRANPGKYMFFDNIHPNYQGYKVIATQLFYTGYYPLNLGYS